MILWIAVLVVAAGARSPFGRRRSTVDLRRNADRSDAESVDAGIAGEATGQRSLDDPIFDDPIFDDRCWTSRWHPETTDQLDAGRSADQPSIHDGGGS